jgi:DNA-binding XRE family transcriptional regulator
MRDGLQGGRRSRLERADLCLMASKASRDVIHQIHQVNQSLRQRLRVKVRALREAAGLTLQMAAERGEMSVQSWQKVEAGEVNVTMAMMVQMANALEVDLPELFAEAEQGEREGELS